MSIDFLSTYSVHKSLGANEPSCLLQNKCRETPADSMSTRIKNNNNDNNNNKKNNNNNNTNNKNNNNNNNNETVV